MQLARFNLFDQSGAGLDQDINVVAEPGQQLCKFFAGKGSAGCQYGDDPGDRLSYSRFNGGLDSNDRQGES
jgi:hypothetical protein